MRRLRPSDHPRLSSPYRNPASHGLIFWIVLREGSQHADASLTGLLRSRRERPRGRAAEQRDELASFHGFFRKPTITDYV